eukprot:jgi/Undpi1/5222/HiC_scaffold_2.g00504.m1
MYVLPDIHRVAAKVKSTQSKVPANSRGLDAEDLRVVGAEQNEGFRNLISSDPHMRDFLVKYDDKVTNVKNKVNQLKLQVQLPQNQRNSPAGGTPLAGDPGTLSSPKGCTQCAAPVSSRASATVDNSAPAKRHAPSTTDSGEGGGPSTPSRRGGEPAAGGGSNRPRRGGGSAQETPEDTTSTPEWPTSPASKDNNLMVVCRCEDMEGAPVQDRIRRMRPARPEGHVVALIPQPFYDHATAIADSLRQVEMKLTLYDHGLVVEYGSRGGGPVSLKKALHLSTDDFMCDGEVMPQDFPGRIRTSEGLRETNPCAASVMTEVPYFGEQKRLPDNVTTFAVQRFSRQRDTVATLTADKDGVLEAALKHGRMVEAFLVDADARSKVNKRLADTFQDSWRMRTIPHESEAGEVGQMTNGTLPMGLHEENTPEAVSDKINTFLALRKAENAGGDEDIARMEAYTHTAEDIAMHLGWIIDNRTEDEGGSALCAQVGTSYKANENAIPIWGRFVVYDSPAHAPESLSADYLEPPTYVRLVRVADSTLLSTMCEHGEEVVSSDTGGLYLEVSPSCPAFHATWEDDESDSVIHDGQNFLDRRRWAGGVDDEEDNAENTADAENAAHRRWRRTQLEDRGKEKASLETRNKAPTQGDFIE